MRVLPAMRRMVAGGALVLLLLPAFSTPAAASARRIVSLNQCTDELLLRLADPSKIGSVTWLSRNPGSNVPELAARVPVNFGRVEEVVAAAPDLVLAGVFSARLAVGMLKRTSIPVVQFAVPETLDDVRRQIREIAGIVQAEEKGRDMIAELDARIAAVAKRPPQIRPTAVVLNPNGVTVGAGTLVDEIITAAGLENIRARPGIDNSGQLPLEILVSSSVDVLIVSAGRTGPASKATEILNHPIIAKLPHTRIVTVPARLWNCGGPGLADAVEQLGAVAAEVSRSKVVP